MVRIRGHIIMLADITLYRVEMPILCYANGHGKWFDKISQKTECSCLGGGIAGLIGDICHHPADHP